MKFSTPNALRKINAVNHKTMLVDGKETCPLQAMSMVFNFHQVDIEETDVSLQITGIEPVARNEKFVLK